MAYIKRASVSKTTIIIALVLVGAFGFSLYATTRGGSNAIDSRASGNRDWSSVYPWKEITDLSSLPGTGNLQSLNERAQGAVLVRTLFRNNHLYSQTVPMTNGTPVWTNASGWNETADISSLPGSGDIQQLSEYLVGSMLVRHLFRNDRLFVHRVPLKNNAPDWSSAPGWTETMDTRSLPGEGSIQSLTERIQGKFLMRTLLRSNRMYIQTVPLENGAPQWSSVHPWSKTTNLSSLPGSGTYEALSEYITGSSLVRTLLRNGEMYSQSVPLSNGKADWSKAGSWNKTADLSSLPGSGTFEALSEYIAGSNLVRTLLRNGHMYSQTVPLANGKADWTKAGPWKETTDLSSLPGSGTFESLSESIINNLITRILFRQGVMYFQTVNIINGNADWSTASPWQTQTDLSTFPGSGTVQAMSEYLAANGEVRTVLRNSIMYSQTVPLTKP